MTSFKVSGYKNLAWLVAAAATLSFKTVAANLPAVEQLQVAPASSATPPSPAAAQMKSSLGISPLSQLATTGQASYKLPYPPSFPFPYPPINDPANPTPADPSIPPLNLTGLKVDQLLEPSYDFSASPLLRIGQFKREVSKTSDRFSMLFQFDIAFAETEWKAFTYKGSQYRWKTKLSASHNWTQKIPFTKVKLAGKQEGNSQLEVSLDFTLNEAQQSGQLFVTQTAEVQKRVANNWQPVKGLFGIVATGTVKRAYPTPGLDCLWLGVVRPLFQIPGVIPPSMFSGIEICAFSGSVACTLEMQSSLTVASSAELVDRRLFIHKQTWSLGNVSFGGRASYDTVEALSRLWFKAP